MSKFHSKNMRNHLKMGERTYFGVSLKKFKNIAPDLLIAIVFDTDGKPFFYPAVKCGEGYVLPREKLCVVDFETIHRNHVLYFLRCGFSIKKSILKEHKIKEEPSLKHEWRTPCNCWELSSFYSKGTYSLEI